MQGALGDVTVSQSWQKKELTRRRRAAQICPCFRVRANAVSGAPGHYRVQAGKGFSGGTGQVLLRILVSDALDFCDSFGHEIRRDRGGIQNAEEHARLFFKVFERLDTRTDFFE